MLCVSALSYGENDPVWELPLAYFLDGTDAWAREVGAILEKKEI